MTPIKFIQDWGPKIQQICPEIRFEFVPFENTPENAREILRNLGARHLSCPRSRFAAQCRFLTRWLPAQGFPSKI